ncbi:hypothetical protein MRX96_047531 [Rhipicephalus microplus]
MTIPEPSRYFKDASYPSSRRFCVRLMKKESSSRPSPISSIPTKQEGHAALVGGWARRCVVGGRSEQAPSVASAAGLSLDGYGFSKRDIPGLVIVVARRRGARKGDGGGRLGYLEMWGGEHVRVSVSSRRSRFDDFQSLNLSFSVPPRI